MRRDDAGTGSLKPSLLSRVFTPPLLFVDNLRRSEPPPSAVHEGEPLSRNRVLTPDWRTTDTRWRRRRRDRAHTLRSVHSLTGKLKLGGELGSGQQVSTIMDLAKPAGGSTAG